MTNTINGRPLDLKGARTAEEIGQRIRAELIVQGFNPDAMYPVSCGEFKSPDSLSSDIVTLDVTFQFVPTHRAQYKPQ